MSRNLSRSTVDDRTKLVHRFQRFTNDWSWQWRPGDVEEFSTQLRDGESGAVSTIQGYHSQLRLFCEARL